jgi:lipopolysaccharide export system protein LptA
MSALAIKATFVAALLVAAMPSAVPRAMAQPGANNAPNALQGFQQNRGQPVQIEASRLEVRDKDKVATFTGSVKVVQGDTTLRCKSLRVFYDQQSKDGQQAQAATQASQTMKAAAPGPGGSSQISRLEASGGVTVTQKDQTATGDTALFDMKSNTVTLAGNVLVSQGPNVMRGERLVVDLTTGVSRVDAGKGPVRMLIQQGPPQEKGNSGSAPRLGPQRPSSSNSPN